MTQLHRSAALFILKAREIHKITQTSLDYLLGDISSFMDMNRTRLRQKITVALKEKGIDMEGDLLAFSNSPDIANPFEGLHTEYLQRQFFMKYFNLVVSEHHDNWLIVNSLWAMCAFARSMYMLQCLERTA